MARLKVLPGLDVIRGYKGTLDFYVRRGVPCVRRWPYTPPSRRTAGSKAAATLFGQILQGYGLLGDGPLTAYREAAADNPRTARDLYVSGVLGHLHERTEPEPPPPPEEEMYDAYLCLRDVKAQNTHAGAFDSGAWRTRDLNDEQADPEDICALAANQFVLAAGTYRTLITCPAYKVRDHQARLYNVTADAVLLLGTSEYSYDATYIVTRSHIVGRFTVAADQTLEVQHRCNTSRASDGLGSHANFTDEIYTVAEFWRETEAE